MYKIALVCQHGASTGMCVKKMQEAAAKNGIEADIDAYSYTQLAQLAEDMDAILIGPQMAFRFDGYKEEYPAAAPKMALINAMDFGMMDGEKILKDAVAMVEANG